jgi:hypothetical protein
MMAELQEVEWFKPNPEHVAEMKEFNALADAEGDEAADAHFAGRELPDEFIDALPGEDGAMFMDARGHMTLDITDGPELHPMDSVLMDLCVGGTVNA